MKHISLAGVIPQNWIRLFKVKK